MARNILEHPCLEGAGAPAGAGATLRVAARSSFRQRYSYDAPLPGMPLTMTPEQALVYARRLAEGSAEKTLAMACIAGPGEPMADANTTLATIERIRTAYPRALVCLCTSGLGLPEHVATLKELGVARIALYVNAVDLDMAKAIYAWVRPGKRNLGPDDGCRLLLAEQAESLRLCVAAGMEVTVESLLVPDVNVDHLPAIAAWAKAGGAAAMRLYPARYAEDAALRVPAETMEAAQAAVAAIIRLKPADCCCDTAGAPQAEATGAGPTAERPCVAVATTDGAMVNEHLGYAARFLVYKAEGGHGRMVEVRDAPPRGGGEDRWKKLAAILPDCFAILAADAGDNPRKVLAEAGIEVRAMAETPIEDAVATVLGLQTKKR